MKYLYWFGILFIIGCQTSDIEYPPNTLGAYIQELDIPVSNQLIACAASIPDIHGNLENSIFFLPVDGAYDFKYFESKDINEDAGDLSIYKEEMLTLDPVFNFLKKFNQVSVENEKWSKVTYRTQDSLHICNPIRIKEPVKPTEINPELLTVQDLNNGQILFSWEDGIYPENAIYFQVVSDENGQLLTGTYTYERKFTLFDLSNVVLNINPQSVNPQLEEGKTYTFTLMAVSLDNWVNLIASKDFEY